MSRRRFLQLMAASFGLAGLTACRPHPIGQIVPYVHPPEELLPGKPLFYATALTLGGYARGVLVQSHFGRPTKVEGNPQHPASLGATDIHAQAAPLTLYDPDRAQTIRQPPFGVPPSGGRRSLTPSEGERAGERGPSLEKFRANGGRGLHFLTETVTSPTLAHQFELLLERFPEARWHRYEPINRASFYDGAQLAFGRPLDTFYRFDRARVIVSLEADFLYAGPAAVRYARDFSSRRRAFETGGEMSRLYVAESTPSITGMAADHRFVLRASEIAGFGWELARKLMPILGSGAGSPRREPPNREASGERQKWLQAMTDDLLLHRGACVIVPGEHQPAEVHALAHFLNHLLGNTGETVVHIPPIEAQPANQFESLRELVAEMEHGRVESLVMLGGNPVYTAPADFEFSRQLERVAQRLHLSLHFNETSARCDWHLPLAHELEAWGDARAFDGTVTIQQPLIAPLYGGRSALEFLAGFAGSSGSSYDVVREFWRARHPTADFETFWQQSLHDGVMAGSAFQPEWPPLRIEPEELESKLQLQSDRPELNGSTELVLRPDPNVRDGEWANNAWLQELPKPITKLTWDNAALISPALAEQFALRNEDVIELELRGVAVRAPVWIVPGQAENSVTLHLGYGREEAGRVARGRGFNAYPLRFSDHPWFSPELTWRKTKARFPLATTQLHHRMEGRDLVRAGTLAEYQREPDFAQPHEHEGEASLLRGFQYDGHAWGMSINLSACLGCNACVVACQAENNTPVVGKEEVRRGREMHWLRIDTYFEGPPSAPAFYQQPILCMHCENAPCELVCPVAATTHSTEGLNEMTYNRCVGTRYCSNNCPYKVRRFNYLEYTDQTTPILKLLRNPRVTVRTRGVMEKCTYCVQRINAARIEAKKENRPIRDGEVVTACQAACPAGAIVFGDINDPESRVARLKREPLDYGLLTELNTRPRTTYLARLRHPNPKLEPDEETAPGHEHHHHEHSHTSQSVRVQEAVP